MLLQCDATTKRNCSLKENAGAMLSQLRFTVEAETLQPSSAADKNHGARGRPKILIVYVVAGFLFHHHGTDEDFQVVVAGSFAEKRAKVVIFLAEETGSEFSVRG